jgi:MscS family membrane protein
VTIRRLLLRLLVVLTAVLCPALTAAASPALPPTGAENGEKAGAAAEEEKVAPDSPRAAMTEFRRLARAGDYAAAARYLDLSKAGATDGPTLAAHLKEVLNRRLWIDLSKLSPESHGNAGDDRAADREQLGTIRAASGQPEPVVLVRKSYRPGTHWVFSAETVAQVEGWYDHLESLWLSEHLPQPLLKMGPRLLRWWQWIALGPLLLVAWGLGFAAARAARLVLVRALKEEHARGLHQLHGPATLAIMVGVVYAAIPWLGLYQPASAFVERWCSAFLVIALFWALWRGVELSRNTVSTSRWARESLSAHSLVSLGARLAKFAVAAAAFVLVLSRLGYQPTTIIAGLGIGGVALALAAQKTVENLFGAFSLAIDQPFREGDTIKVDGIDGLVEAVGLRSTRIRSADRTVISLPNGKLADMRIETISRQDRLRFFCAFALAHGKSEQLERIVSEIKALIAAEPLVDPRSIGVRFVALSDAGMNIEAGAMLSTTDGAQYADAKERLLLGILRIVEKAGAKLAHPTQRVELVSSPPHERALAASSNQNGSSSPGHSRPG